MDFYGIEMKGPFILEFLDTIPEFDLENDTGRLIYTSDTNLFYLGTDIKWITFANVEDLNYHINNINNPHNTTKAQVGLSNVENYPVASEAEAILGSETEKYVTPFGVKRHVDERILSEQDILNIINANIKQTTYTYGVNYSTSGYTDQVGSFNDGANYFDVFPPSGYTMEHLKAFIPSLHVVHYAGDVNRDDSIRTTYSVRVDRIRVWVQNTEQRSTPAANWLAIWEK